MDAKDLAENQLTLDIIDREYTPVGTTSRRASTAFLAGKKTSSFIFGRNVARVKILT
jgi:hypothetical protein